MIHLLDEKDLIFKASINKLIVCLSQTSLYVRSSFQSLIINASLDRNHAKPEKLEPPSRKTGKKIR